METYTLDEIMSLPWETTFEVATQKKQSASPKNKYSNFWDGYSSGVIAAWKTVDEYVAARPEKLDIDGAIMAGFNMLDTFLIMFEEASPSGNADTINWCDGAVVGAVEVLHLVFELKKNGEFNDN